MLDTQKIDNVIEKIIITQQQIQNRVNELGAQITKDYDGKRVVLVCILKGACLFASDLCRALSLPVKLDFMAVSSYKDSTKSSGEIKVEKGLSENIKNEHVLIVEDIIDTGLTMSHVIDLLKAQGPASIKVCVLCHKPSNLQNAVKVDYCGFSLNDGFVVGYGLDHKGLLRNLPYIGVIKPQYR